IAETHKRFAFPFACLTLTAMTFILAIQGRRFTTRPRTVMAILFLAMGFYLLLVLGQNLALSGTVPGWLGGWFSNFIYGAFILRSFITNKTPCSGFLSFLIPPTPAGDVNDRSMSHTPGSERQVVVGKISRGIPVISLNLINYLLMSEVVKYFVLAV